MKSNRRKFIFLSLTLPLLLFSKNENNFCENDILNKKALTLFTPIDNLNLDDKYKELSGYLNELRLKPYNSELMEKSLNLILTDYDISKNNKSYKNLFLNKDIASIMFNSFIFVDMNYIKKYESKLFEIFSEPGVYKSISQKSYFNYLVLYKVGFFKYKEQEDAFLSGIRITKDDFIYYYLASNIFKFNENIIYSIDSKIENNILRLKDAYIKKCFSSKSLENFKEKVNVEDLLTIIILMDIYKENNKELTYLYYNVNNGSSLLNYLNMYMKLLKEDYYEAFELIKTVYEYEKKPEYIKLDFLSISVSSSNKSMLLNDYYKTRYFCIEALYVYGSIKNKTSSIISQSLILKSNLKNSSEKIINASLSDNNIDNSNFLIRETRRLLKIK